MATKEFVKVNSEKNMLYDIQVSWISKSGLYTSEEKSYFFVALLYLKIICQI